ncbi:MAG: alkaline shock response membrane anchor protein AmaP [Clostridiales bacterium]|nr:alkaline shock response membrane anchor protein AmaP [Clostridiales bacterium]
MKMKLWDRVILFLGALLCLGAGAWLAVDGIAWMLNTADSMAMWVRAAKAALGVITVLFSLYLLAFPRKLAYRKRDFVVQHTDTGELRIAVKAIENLVQKCIDMHDEIQVDTMRIKNSRDGVTVDMSIALANNIAIPLAVSSLQKQIKQYLVASSGIEVKEVRVSVITTQSGVGESPYLVNSDEEQKEQASAPAQQEKKKAPLHQRLFRRGDQAVTVPEPPLEKEEMPAAAEEAGAAEEAAEEEKPLETAAEEMPETTPAEEQEEDAHE